MTSRTVLAMALFGALPCLPIAAASAQDVGAVKKRLAESVAAGAITKGQAAAMPRTLAKSSGDKVAKDTVKDRDIDPEELGARLKAAVLAGKMTEAKAMKKCEAAQKGGEGPPRVVPLWEREHPGGSTV